MSSYNDYDGFPIQSSYYWLTTRLRGEMGFRGYVVSDSDAVEYLYTKHGTAKDMKRSRSPKRGSRIERALYIPFTGFVRIAFKRVGKKKED